MTDNNTVALAFSGGLDTTVCVPLLEEEYDYDEVIGVTVDVGQPAEEFDEAEETADALDLDHYVVDAKDAFADQCLDAVKANATYQGYPLGTALARPVIAEAILDVAVENDCDAVAHGCTGKGNDQLRFEAVWRDSDLEVIAPVRELGLTREWEMEYADEKGLPVEGGNEGDWSIDTNLWSRSVEGADLEDPGYVPPEDIYEWTDAPGQQTTEDGEFETIEIAFEDGYPVAIDTVEGTSTSLQPPVEDGEEMPAVQLIEYLNDLAGSYGVGRTDMMEDRMLGLKVRENYEHPAATTLLNAHEALEGLVLTEEERAFKKQVDQQWAEKAYEGLLSAPLVDALDGFVDTTQEKVTGTVTVKFEGGQARPVARESDYAVYSESAASFNTESVDGIAQADATGVAKYHGFQSRLANAVAKDAEAKKAELLTDGSGDETEETEEQ
ncbi:argininosuccinate synthase [Halorussus sp. MSC15.2]|uniref:argininosuccinate synthase n=1 Tax=Halorussus sp. MSC15.2 TaxID=2283638 RepID=UPI0013D6E0EF|nr:argininosuccinate synthase [Halorussus sp. MSC15.2]NEU55273.1 argininosuccinate synthase [Halorussus sp. MSC15.2]